MNAYVVLLRGVNVGGKNKVPMAALRECLQELGFSDVATYIASGNALFRSDKSSAEVQSLVEAVLPHKFELDNELIRVLVLSRSQLQAVVDKRPAGFGDHPDLYHSDVLFLMDDDVAMGEVMSVFRPREGVDKVWAGAGVVYSQRLSAERVKSRLNKVTESPFYKAMTIRSWATTTKLLQLLKDMDKSS